MKYLGKITDPKDLVTKEYVDNHSSSDAIPASLGTAAGDIIYFSAASTPTRLAKGSDGQYLKLASGVPSWATLTGVNSSNSTSKMFLIGATAQNTSPSTGSNSNIVINTKADKSTAETGSLVATKVYNAVWNDYAEYRLLKEDIEIPYGRVLIENGDDTISVSTKRLQPGAMICSDTYGTCMGEVNGAPIALAGRTLAYPLEPREEFGFFIGQAVCSGPNGTVSIMTKDEVKEYPEAVVGYVSAIPQYETWGTGNVKVDGRIWIKVK